jgi:predicted DNA-binding protein YlxM (UPF0122 family)
MKKSDYIEWETEHKNVYNLSLQGLTMAEIGKKYNVSRERIRQVLQKYYPWLTSDMRGSQLLSQQKRAKIVEDRFNKHGRENYIFVDDLTRRMSDSFRRKRQNAKESKWGWELTIHDIEWATVCPVLGIELDWFAEAKADNSPSYDRVDSTKGYVPGNVRIISFRANRIKNDGTIDEHKKIIEYMENHFKSIDSK